MFEKLKQMRKKGEMSGGLMALVSAAIAFVVIGIVLSLGSQIISQNQATQTVGTAAYNVSGNTLSALTTLSSYQGLLALAVVAAVIIGIILAYFKFRTD